MVRFSTKVRPGTVTNGHGLKNATKIGQHYPGRPSLRPSRDDFLFDPPKLKSKIRPEVLPRTGSRQSRPAPSIFLGGRPSGAPLGLPGNAPGLEMLSEALLKRETYLGSGHDGKLKSMFLFWPIFGRFRPNLAPRPFQTGPARKLFQNALGKISPGDQF